MNGIDVLVEKEEVVRCSVCGELSAYSWEYVTAQSQYRLDTKPGEIAHVGACSSYEWECGHCGAHHVDIGSPLLAEVYTHVDPDAFLVGDQA